MRGDESVVSLPIAFSVYFVIDYSTPTMTLAVDMQINALACNAELREGSLPTSPNSFPPNL